MTSIEEALRSGAVRLVPVEATGEMLATLLRPFDSPPQWWTAFLAASPDHTPALLALIEERDRLKVEVGEARGLLGRCRTVLGNMAQENEGAIFNRWPISHEPLRADARNLLPLIEKEIGCES